MLREANSAIKNGMIRLKHLTGDSSYIKSLKIDEHRQFTIDADVMLLVKLPLPQIDFNNQNSQLVFRFKYISSVMDRVHVYGSTLQKNLFEKVGSCFWGDKPLVKKLLPKQLQTSNEEPEGKTYFYLAFYSDTGCDQVDIRPTFSTRFDLQRLMKQKTYSPFPFSPAKQNKI